MESYAAEYGAGGRDVDLCMLTPPTHSRRSEVVVCGDPYCWCKGTKFTDREITPPLVKRLTPEQIREAVESWRHQQEDDNE